MRFETEPREHSSAREGVILPSHERGIFLFKNDRIEPTMASKILLTGIKPDALSLLETGEIDFRELFESENDDPSVIRPVELTNVTTGVALAKLVVSPGNPLLYVYEDVLEFQELAPVPFYYPSQPQEMLQLAQP